MAIEGWLLDLYPKEAGETVVWLKTTCGETLKLVDKWLPSIYVACDDGLELEHLAKKKEIQPYIKGAFFEEMVEKITETKRSLVLKLLVNDARRLKSLAGTIEDLSPFGLFRIYNADISPEQSYLYEKDLFPLAFCEVESIDGHLRWSLKDDPSSLNYALPLMRTVLLAIEVRKSGKIPKLTDPVSRIIIEDEEGEGKGEERIVLEGPSEEDTLLSLSQALEELDPDIVFTYDGDTFDLHHLAARAEALGLNLQLGRDDIPLKRPSKDGTSYFSYGKILYKPSPIRLFGRLHIDRSNTFVMSEAGLHGLYEVSRVCRIPLQSAARASIGKCMSSLQFYQAHRNGILVPWKPFIAENFKTRLELLKADRGGFIFEPLVGVHGRVGEIDFSSLYPNIMLKKNLSCETVKCVCCPNSTNRVPELGWNVCERRKGITPLTLELLIWKREEYKKLRDSDPLKSHLYDARQTALKWILVTSFGYLGFNNAKFGRIDAHIAVCAWDRKILMDSARIAEDNGYEVVHGIVDSLWLKKNRARDEDYLRLVGEIEENMGFELSFEGIYKWVAFLSSKVYDDLPVINRYFGVFEDGRVKVRGIEARRHDTPPFLSRCQMEIVNTLAKADGLEEAKWLVPECKELFKRYVLMLYRREVSRKELIITKCLSKDWDAYKHQTLEAIVAKQLAKEGLFLRSGQKAGYLITDFYSKDPNGRCLAEELLGDDNNHYDAKRYIGMLADVCGTVLEPFQCSKEELMKIPILEEPLRFQ